jgi:hypothetical protein
MEMRREGACVGWAEQNSSRILTRVQKALECLVREKGTRVTHVPEMFGS